MENKYWFISYYACETRNQLASVHNIIVKCKHPLLHILQFYHNKAIFWSEVEESVAKEIIKKGMQFEDMNNE